VNYFNLYAALFEPNTLHYIFTRLGILKHFLKYAAQSRYYLPQNAVYITIVYITTQIMGTTVAQWLRCCATNRKVAGSIPAGVTGILH